MTKAVLAKSHGLRKARMVLAASGWIVFALAFLPYGSSLRPAAAFVFVLSCPGAALVRRWPGHDVLERTVLAVGVSMSLAMLVAEILILAHAWSAPLALAGLAAITSVGALLPAARAREEGRTT